MDDVRWMALAAGILIESIAGSPYAVSVWLPSMKATLSLTQQEANNVAGLGDLGLYMSIIGGVLYDATGPRTVLVYGATLASLGYLALWAVVTQRLAASPGMVAFLAAVAWQGSGVLDTVAVAVAVSNFKPNKGRVLGLVKSLFGLSAGVLSLAYGSLMKPHTDAFLLFLAVAVPAVVLPTLYFHRVAPEAAVRPLTTREGWKISAGYAAVLALALYLVLVSLLQGRGLLAGGPGYAWALVPAVAVHVLLAARVEPPKGSAGGGAPSDGEGGSSGGDSQALLLGDDGEGEGEGEGGAKGAAAGDGAPAGATFFEGVLTLDYGLLLLIFFALTGAGLTVINNLGSLVTALTPTADAQDVYVSLLSVFNCGGRIFFGWASDRWAGALARPWWLAVLLTLMAAATTGLAFASLESLYVLAPLAGFAYGGAWSLCPALVSERYGGRAFASINSLTNVATAVASYALNSGLAAAVYDAHTPAGSTVCSGIQCFQVTFLALAGLNAAGVGLCLLLGARMRRFYAPDGKAVPYAEIESSLPPNALAARIEGALCRRRRGVGGGEGGE